MGIIFRTYEPNDDEGLSSVFNIALQNIGPSYLRTPKRIAWRYPNRPAGDPKEIQVAYDLDQNRVVGAVYSTIDSYRFNGQSYRVGAINDVGVLPEYGGRGIGKKLMEQAIEYMDSRDCDYSVLSADPQGNPRAKLYTPLGWRDFIREQIWFHVTNYLYLFRYFPAILPMLPAFEMARSVRLLKIHQLEKKIFRKGIRVHHYLPSKEYGLTPTLSRQLFRFFNEVTPHQMDGLTNISLEDWIYFRERPVFQDLLPVYVTLSYKDQIIGYAAFLKQFMYASKLGLRFPVAFMREILVDHRFNRNLDEISEMYQLLVGKFGQAAFNFGCGVIVYNISPNNLFLNTAFKSLGYARVSGSMFMIKSMNNHVFPKQSVKPFQIGAGENFGYP